MRAARVLLDDIDGQFGALGDQVRSYLHRAHVRTTPARIAVMAALAAAPVEPLTATRNGDQNNRLPGHLTAEEIHRALRGYQVRFDATTVYRTVHELKELDLVHGAAIPDRATRFGLSQPAHHHTLCTECGALGSLPAQPLQALLNAASQLTNLTSCASSALTFQGTCPRCQERA